MQKEITIFDITGLKLKIWELSGFYPYYINNHFELMKVVGMKWDDKKKYRIATVRGNDNIDTKFIIDQHYEQKSIYVLNAEQAFAMEERMVCTNNLIERYNKQIELLKELTHSILSETCGK